MIRRLRNFNEDRSSKKIRTALDLAKLLKRKGMVVSTAPYPSDGGVKDGDCFVALKPNSDYIVFYDYSDSSDEPSIVLAILASWNKSGFNIETEEDLRPLI